MIRGEKMLLTQSGLNSQVLALPRVSSLNKIWAKIALGKSGARFADAGTFLIAYKPFPSSGRHTSVEFLPDRIA